jgi:hypothetical protein
MIKCSVKENFKDGEMEYEINGHYLSAKTIHSNMIQEIT